MLRGISRLFARIGLSLGNLLLKMAKLSALAVTIGSLLIVLDALLFPDDESVK